jgi:STE24 endopeptidase
MNVISIIILFALILDFGLGLAANLLNLRSVKLAAPASLADIYKPEDYAKSQRYLIETMRFGIFRSVFALVVLLAFWFSGGFNYFDQVVRGWGLPSLPQGLLYIGLLAFAYGLLMLPFGIYGTFSIEARFGFNRTTIRTFILDLMRGGILALLVGGAVLSGVLAIFEYAGGLAWLYCWIAVSIFSLVMQYVAPNWIMPLFNKFKPLEPGELRDSILEYSAIVKFPLRNVLVMDGSRRSSKSNAFFTGFGRNKRIALFDTLIANHTVPELIAVLAHEVGHFKKKHILQGTIISFLHSGLILFLVSLFIHSGALSQAFYMNEPSIYSGLLFFGLLFTPLELVLSIFLNYLSRRNESEADRFAATTAPEPGSLIQALKKLSAANLSNLTPHPLYVWLFYSHPPLGARIEALRSQTEAPPD